ncbi:uncharacterized protein LOC111129804 isoform X2 [Crassostrea virginica]
MKLWSALNVLTAFIINIRRVDAKLDLQSVMKSYINICGPGYTCNDWSALVKMPNEDKNYMKQNLCRECACENSCFQQKNCCPDKYFSRAYTKYKSVIVNYPASARREKGLPLEYAVVDYCPSDSKSDHRHQCEHETSPYDTLTSPPVTSSASNVSYQSRHCAYCHGENETDLHEWRLTVDRGCMERRTIFYLSSHANILSYAQNSSCALVFYPRQDLQVIQQRDLTLEYRARCNVTGTWAEFNPDVQMACESSYDLTYRFYTNIFCAMCNPIELKTHRVISSCNVTGEWREYDASLEQACIDNPGFQMTQPYKNVFCFLCNSRGNAGRIYLDMYSYNDVKLTTREFISNFKTYIYKFNRIAFHNDFLHDEIKMRVERNRTTEQYVPGVMTINEKQINITHLLMKSLSISPAPICDKTLIPPLARNYTLDNCQCNPQCMMEKPCECCLDVALSWPTTCVKGNSKKMLNAFNGCRRTDNRYDGSPFYAAIRRMCEQNISTLDQITVTSGGLTFRNIYCYLCNSQIKVTEADLEIPSSPSFDVWGATIECSEELNIFYSARYTDILSFAISSSKCQLSFNTVRSFECSKQVLRDGPGRCNETNQLDVDDPAVHWACEGSHYNKYISTAFCLHCNPRTPLTDDVIIDKCDNSSKHYSSIYDEACQLFPDAVFTTLALPKPRIKNRFCGMCSALCVDYSCMMTTHTGDCTADPGSNVIRPPLLTHLLRFYGVIADFNTNEQNTTTNIVCFPGKTLVDGNCSFLFQTVGRANYTLNFMVNVTLKSSAIGVSFNITKSLDSVLASVKWKLGKMFSNEIKEQFIFLTEETYSPDHSTRAAYCSVIIYIQIEVLGYHDRASMENALFNFPSKFNFNTQEFHIAPGNFTTFPSTFVSAKGYVHVPPYIVKDALVKPPANYREYLVSLNKSFLKTPLENSVVGPLFFCKQIAYKWSDFDVDYHRFEIIFKKTNQRFPMNKFVVSLDGAIHICDIDAEWWTLYTIRTNKPLWIFAQICTCISLLCLFLTFIIYCLFKPLRTIPGLNLMSLVFSLFCAQLLFLFTVSTKDQFWCVAIGILQHYFWLSTCFCLLICCFHMYRVFNSQELVRSGIYFTPRTFYKYVTFSYLLPVIIVGSNVGVMIRVNGTLGARNFLRK